MRLGTSLDEVSSIYRDILPVQVLAGCTEQYCGGHVRLLSRSLRRQISLVLLGQFALLIILALTSSHFRGEDTRSDSVDADLQAAALDFSREHLVEVNHGTLGGIVVEVALRDTDETRDG